MSKGQLQEELSLQLLYASLRGKFEMSEAVESDGLTFMQAAILCLLSPGDSLPMNALSDFLGCTPSYITGIIEQLASAAFVTREEWTNDRRIKAVSLTTKGVTLRTRLLKIALRARLPQVASLSSAELQAAIKIINKAAVGAPDLSRSLKPTQPHKNP